MPQRLRKTKAPCAACGLNPALCICAQMPRLQTSTRLLLVVHARELKRTTNTGRLAVKALENSVMRVRGEGRERLDLSPDLHESYKSLLLYPSDDAAELNSDFLQGLRAGGEMRPIQLIVPDGNWRQAGKVGLRHPELAAVRRVKISQPNKALYHLRAEHSEYGMSTLEAIAKAYRVCESEEAYQKLQALYEAKLTATLTGRGTIGPVLQNL